MREDMRAFVRGRTRSVAHGDTPRDTTPGAAAYARSVTDAREVPIRGRMIRLGQLLKLADVTSGGGEAKALLARSGVLVNGEREERRGRQLVAGDVVEVAGERLVIVSGG